MGAIEEGQEFWNQFATEYYDIQQESFTTIVEDLTRYLLEIEVLPCAMFVDIAGGYGKYLQRFAEYAVDCVLVDFSSSMIALAKEKLTAQNIQFVKTDQMTFCMNSRDNQYDVVFSAMNPALKTIEQLNELYRVTKKELLLVHVAVDEDDIFTPIEQTIKQEAVKEPTFKMFKQWLIDSKYAWTNQFFHYHQEERVTKAFVKDYFEAERIQFPEVNPLIDHLFAGQVQQVSHHHIHFELLRIMK